MQIGIITFHWATNYGAILQTYALQSYLLSLGHNVKIINYKPSHFDYSFISFLKNRQFLSPLQYFSNYKKEKKMLAFRNKYLNLTERVTTQDYLCEVSKDFDCVITGSDQVLNPSFLQFGEKNGSTAYFLGFKNSKIKRIGYAVSFGTVKYPSELLSITKPLISNFNSLSVRESTGRYVLSQMGILNVPIVPDPTLLLSVADYNKLTISSSRIINRKPFTFVYLLHNRTASIKKRLKVSNLNFIFSKNESIESWLSYIKFSSSVITNSFHGVVFCLLYHIPFIVVLKTKENVGMNDRFFTLLEQCDLISRIYTEKDFPLDFINDSINWEIVDLKLHQFIQCGTSYLCDNL